MMKPPLSRTIVPAVRLPSALVTGGLNRVLTHVYAAGVAYEQTRAWVVPGDSLINVASNIYGNTSLRVFFELEPSFTGAAAGGSIRSG